MKNNQTQTNTTLPFCNLDQTEVEAYNDNSSEISIQLEFMEKLLKNSYDVDPNIIDLVNHNFWDLI